MASDGAAAPAVDITPIGPAACAAVTWRMGGRTRVSIIVKVTLRMSPDAAMIPHGMSVILNAPAVFRFTAPACPERHLDAARMQGADVRSAALDDAGEVLSARITELMKATGIPNGLARGVRAASDFLMALQLTGAAKFSSIANLQIRLPVVVIGGGLTAIDTATESLAYYVRQVEKFSTKLQRVFSLGE